MRVFNRNKTGSASGHHAGLSTVAMRGPFVGALCLSLLLLIVFASPARAADTTRKRYTFDYNRATRKASSMVAAKEARKRFLRDYLAEKFSAEITNHLAEDIDIALDPPDQYISAFNVVSERLNEDETKVTLTIEGTIELASMIAALVQNKVLSFGKEPPRIMVLPSSRLNDSRAAKSLRALIYNKVKEAGLRPIAFESTGESVSFRVREKVSPGESERKVLIRHATQYGADYLMYIDAEVETKPFSQGGFISDANFIYTILRPNGGLILGESIVSERGSGSSPMLAFDRALDSIAPTVAQASIGQLFESIYSDSDVIYNTPRLREEKTIVIHWGAAQQVQVILDRLQGAGARVSLTTGMSDAASRLKVETEMDDLELYEWFNSQRFAAAGKTFKTPVVAYSENVMEVEVVEPEVQPKRQPIAKAPTPKPRKPASRPASRPAEPGSPDTQLAKVTLRLRPAQFNR